mgnify:CR=1 FL=1
MKATLAPGVAATRPGKPVGRRGAADAPLTRLDRRLGRTARSGPAGGWASISIAFKRSLVSQFQPRMLVALVMPFLIMFVGLILLSWLLWTPIQNWLLEVLGGWNAFESVDQWLVGLGLFSLNRRCR